jgi:hypothetical protein
MTVRVYIVDHDTIEIIPLGTLKVILLKVETRQELQEWAVSLYHHIHESIGFKNGHMMDGAKIPNFWKIYIISRRQFFEEA